MPSRGGVAAWRGRGSPDYLSDLTYASRMHAMMLPDVDTEDVDGPEGVLVPKAQISSCIVQGHMLG